MSADDNVGPNYYKNRNKKKKRNKFLQNAKGFGRKNIFGRGAELDQGDYNYFLEILSALNGLEDVDDKVTMANNVYEQIKDKEIKVSSNQLSSRVLENLLGYTDSDTFDHLMGVFSDNFRVVCSDKFASHVLQKMLFVAFLRGVSKMQAESSSEERPPAKKHKFDGNQEFDYNLKTEFSTEHLKACRDFVKRLSMFLMNNLEEFVWDQFGNYVIRQCILNLSGTAELKIGKSDNIDTKCLEVPQKWGKIVTEYASRLMEWPQFVEFPYNEYTSVLLQNLMTSLAKVDAVMLQQLCNKILDTSLLQVAADDENEEGEETESKTNLPKVFTFDCPVRLLEVILSVVEPALFKQLYTKLFATRLAQLSNLRISNFAVQKFLDNISEKAILDTVFNELENEFENILRTGHTGVIASLAKACVRLCGQQGKFVKILLQALKCSEANADKVIMPILQLMPHEIAEKTENSAIHIHGSIVLQSILEFNKPIKIVGNILEIKNDKLTKIFCDPKGSHVVNAFVRSKFVGEKSREKLVRHLEGCYMDLALSVHGSRVLELLFESAAESHKTNIVRELSSSVSQLNSKPWGAIINKKLLVDVYRNSPSQWKSAINADEKLDKLFSKIIK